MLTFASIHQFKHFNRLYAAQWEVGARNLLRVGVLGIANIIIVAILWCLFGGVEVKKIPFTPFALLGFLFYIIQLMRFHAGVHTYVCGHLQYWLSSNNRKTTR